MKLLQGVHDSKGCECIHMCVSYPMCQLCPQYDIAASTHHNQGRNNLKPHILKLFRR